MSPGLNPKLSSLQQALHSRIVADALERALELLAQALWSASDGSGDRGPRLVIKPSVEDLELLDGEQLEDDFRKLLVVDRFLGAGSIRSIDAESLLTSRQTTLTFRALLAILNRIMAFRSFSMSSRWLRSKSPVFEPCEEALENRLAHIDRPEVVAQTVVVAAMPHPEPDDAENVRLELRD